jgi:FAD/FMN-containing dehydrogenase
MLMQRYDGALRRPHNTTSLSKLRQRRMCKILLGDFSLLHCSFGLTVNKIIYANANNKPFHAISGAHAITAYLNKVENAVGIFMRGMDNITITKNGDTALIGGGILNGDVLDYLWAHKKQTMTTACACVGYISPILGGGHGWNQGRYGLAADQLVSARMVLANGTAVTVNADRNPDLFWAIRGAGHNFGIVTRAEIKIYDRKPSLDQWTVDVFYFTHDKMEEVVGIANTWLESTNRPVRLDHYIMFYFDTKVDPVNVRPIISYDVGCNDSDLTADRRRLRNLSGRHHSG